MKRDRVLIIGGLIGLYLYSRETQGSMSFSPMINEISNDFSNWTDIIMGNPTRGERNNNPGNIRPASYTWQGQTGVADNFVVFSDPVYGIRAIAKDLLTKFGRGLDTVAKIISVYAPPSENLTSAYISSVAGALGVGADTPLNLYDPYVMTAFVKAIIKHENGRVAYDDALISHGVNLAMTG